VYVIWSNEPKHFFPDQFRSLSSNPNNYDTWIRAYSIWPHQPILIREGLAIVDSFGWILVWLQNHRRNSLPLWLNKIIFTHIYWLCQPWLQIFWLKIRLNYTNFFIGIQ
jgi:hypothetical protein